MSTEHRPTQWDTAVDEHARTWRSLVAAGGIGAPPEIPPAVAATLAANDALFRARAARLREAAR